MTEKYNVRVIHHVGDPADLAPDDDRSAGLRLTDEEIHEKVRIHGPSSTELADRSFCMFTLTAGTLIAEGEEPGPMENDELG